MCPALAFTSHRITTAARRRAVATFAATLCGATLAACNDTTSPATPPDDTPDTAVYDLIFQQDAFPLNAWDLRIRRAGGGDHALLFGQQLYGVEPSASRDGRTIVFQGFGAWADDPSDLWIIRAGAAAERVPLPRGNQEFAPSLSPDGTRIAYTRLGDDRNAHLWTANVDGSNQRQLLASDIGIETLSATPAWSPDGARIAWSFGPPGSLRIAVINADGSNFRRLSADVAGAVDLDANWSPDGTQIAFVRMRTPAASDLIIVTVATGTERAFGLPRRNREPAWAPDGRTIVFSSTMNADEIDAELYSIAPDGSALTRLTFDDANQRHPVWLRR